jgi:hypothetical protein
MSFLGIPVRPLDHILNYEPDPLIDDLAEKFDIENLLSPTIDEAIRRRNKSRKRVELHVPLEIKAELLKKALSGPSSLSCYTGGVKPELIYKNFPVILDRNIPTVQIVEVPNA